MKNAYHEIMDRVQMDDAMKGRVLRSMENPPRKRRRWLPWTAGAAACLVLALGGFALLHQPQAPAPRPSQAVTVVSPLTHADSLEALEALVGFPVEEPKSLPFASLETIYQRSNALAEIRWDMGDDMPTYRKGLGTEDISGDWNTYPHTQDLELEGLSVTLRGTEAGYSAAIWTDGTYAWSMNLPEPQSEEFWTAWILELYQ